LYSTMRGFECDVFRNVDIVLVVRCG